MTIWTLLCIGITLAKFIASGTIPSSSDKCMMFVIGRQQDSHNCFKRCILMPH